MKKLLPTSVPKPSRRSPPAQQKKNKKGVGRSRRDATQGTSLRRNTPVRKVNRARRKSEFARAYGSKARVAFVKSLPCVACGQIGASSNAHIETDGMGRKSAYTQIAPLCEFTSDHGTYGCHRRLHNIGRDAFERRHQIDLEAAAAATESAWRAFQGGDE